MSAGRSARRIGSQIERHTRISRQHLTPELRLRLLLPECPLYHADARFARRHLGSDEPYWAIYWPGGQALARYILDEGSRLFASPKRVLDVGAGCAAAGIAAKIAGAEDVLINDIDEVACIAAAKNAWLNGVKVRLSADDLIGRELPEPFDLLLIGDLLYDEDIARRLETWLDEVASEGCEIFLADPGRHGLTPRLRRKLAHLRTYRLPDNVRRENHGYDEASVWKFVPAAATGSSLS